ncbi:MAG: hypothetical protein MJ092_01325 [Lachnospiraceae bacterium]|nr:hypothetical protein [Lachnospiraceae bacterium]
MSNFKLQQEGYTSTTSIPNCFIEKYMPKAAGEFVKIYIYLLKCLAENQSELSISKIADAFDDSEKDVTRALKYWERKGLLKLEFDDKTLVSLQLISAAEMDEDSKEATGSESKEDVSSSDVVTTIVRNEVSVTPDSSTSADDSAKNTPTFEKRWLGGRAKKNIRRYLPAHLYHRTIYGPCSYGNGYEFCILLL